MSSALMQPWLPCVRDKSHMGSILLYRGSRDIINSKHEVCCADQKLTEAGIDYHLVDRAEMCTDVFI